MPEVGQFNRINVLGVGLSAINLDLALGAIDAALARKSKGYVCVTGVHGVMEAQQDESLRLILNQSFLNTPDGMPMVWLGRLNGAREMDRVYGPDLMLLVCELAQKKGYTHFLYGGAEGVAQELRKRLEAKFPAIQIVGTYTPPFRPLDAGEEAGLIRIVKETKPDIFWVGLSTPKQEKFMAKFCDKLDATLFFGVGAAFDFHAGRVRQAPRWMQRSGLEWLFRLYCEPRRLWRRYLRNNPLFAVRVLCQWAGLKKYELKPVDKPARPSVS
jgi:N-acetylglucosaminyldiphosphoundecaprenol N-acetyl-beta-D-mannosaminyltransferase